MTNDFFRTAIFKSSDRNILLLKIRLPELNEGEYGSELSRSVNSFYRELCKRYIQSASEAVRAEGEKLIDIYRCPLTLSVSWQSRSEAEKVTAPPVLRRRKRAVHRCDSEDCIGFLRIEKLYSREGIIKSREILDLFDEKLGFLLK